MEQRPRKLPAPVRASSFGPITRCRGAKRVMESVQRAGNDQANFGSAFAEAQRRKRSGSMVDYSAIAVEFGLTDAEAEELRRLQFRIPFDYDDWTLVAERAMACDENMLPVAFTSPKALFTGHPDVVAFHRTIPGLVRAGDDKTGRVEILDFWQLRVYCALVLANFPEAQIVDAVYDYYRLGKSVGRHDKDGNPIPYTRAEFMGSYWPQMVKVAKESQARRPTYTHGVQCRYCAPWKCPAWGNWRKSFLASANGNGEALAVRPQDMAPAEYVKWVLPRLKVAQSAIDELEEQVKSLGRLGRIDLGDGTVYENRPQRSEKIDFQKALPLLLELSQGDAGKLLSVIEKLSKSQLYAYVKLVFEQPKGMQAKMLEALAEVEAVDVSERERVAVYSGETTVNDEE